MIKLVSYLLVLVAVVNSQIPNAIIWDDHHAHQQIQQHPQSHHIPEHAREIPQEGEETLGSPLIGLKLAKPFMFGIPGLRYSNFHMGHLGPFKYANTLLGAQNPQANEPEVQYQADPSLASHHHHHHIQEVDSQLAAPLQYHYQAEPQAPQHYAPIVAAPPCQHYNLGAPQMMPPMEHQQQQPIVQPMNFFPHPAPLPVEFQPEQRTWGKGYGG